MMKKTYVIIGILVIAALIIGTISYYYYPRPPPSAELSTYSEPVVLPFQIDPAMSASLSASETAYMNLYDDLVYLGENNVLVPNAAQSWEWSQDGKTCTFHLRQGIKFHDGIDTMKAEDVVFSMNRILTIGQGVAYIYAPFLESVVAVDDYTVQFNLNRTFGPFVASLQKFFIADKDLVMEHIVTPGSYGDLGDYCTGWLSTHDAGSGAYMVKEFLAETGLTAERFDDYWGVILPNAPHTLKLIGVSDATVIRTMFQDRTLENSGLYTSDEMLTELDNINGVDLFRGKGTDIAYSLSLNTLIPPLDDIHVRRAMFYAFNYSALKAAFSQYWAKYGEFMSTNIITNWLPGADPALNKPFQQNLTRAAEELSQSKYSGNISQYTIEYDFVKEVPAREKLSLVFAASMNQLGLNVRTVSTPWATQLQRFEDQSMPVVEIGFYLDYVEAIAELKCRYSDSTGHTFYNNAHLNNQTIDDMLNDIESTVNDTERYEKSYVFEHMILDQCVDIPLVQWQFITAYQSHYLDLSEALKIPQFYSITSFTRLIQQYPEKRAELL